MRTEFLISLQEAVRLTDHHQYTETKKLVDDLSEVPHKTNAELQELNQVRGFLGLRQSDR